MGRVSFNKQRMSTFESVTCLFDFGVKVFELFTQYCLFFSTVLHQPTEEQRQLFFVQSDGQPD